MNKESRTNASLLSRLRDPGDQQAWGEFDGRYRELLLRFCIRRGLPFPDAEDVVQRVFTNLSVALHDFEYDPARGRFRDYLHRVAKNAISEWASRTKTHRATLSIHNDRGEAEAVALAATEDVAWEEEWVAHHYRMAMITVRASFEIQSVQIFERTLAGVSVEQLAREFSTTPEAVYQLRHRIRLRLRELIDQQIREEDASDG